MPFHNLCALARHGLLAFSLLTLVACGGGGSGGNSAAPPDNYNPQPHEPPPGGDNPDPDKPEPKDPDEPDPGDQACAPHQSGKLWAASSGKHKSLYDGPAPRPGPDILYWDAPRAPQLENTGVWQSPPILISGASAYRCGEFLYQDYLYDDRGANAFLPDLLESRHLSEIFSRANGTYSYPTDPVYAGNAADFVEIRVKELKDATAFRVTLNSLIDPERVAFTIAIGDSGEPRPFPHGANVSAPAEMFLTVHGYEAELRKSVSSQPIFKDGGLLNPDEGKLLKPSPVVSVDLERRQYDVRIPHEAWKPGKNPVRLAAGVGLWDKEKGEYLRPSLTRSASKPGGAGLLPRPAAFFNVAFRFNEPMPDMAIATDALLDPAWWREMKQAHALRKGDISDFHVWVDFEKLRAKVYDDMSDTPEGVPQTGPMNRIYASHFAPGQGVDFSASCFDRLSFTHSGDCHGEFLGQLQAYGVYVPEKEPPKTGYGLTLLLHSLSANFNQYLGSNHQAQLGERGRGHIVITPSGRGPDGWYVQETAADTFEVWADVARHYPLDPDVTVISGYSMGGYATFKFASRYPDLFAKAHAIVGPPGIGMWFPPGEPSGGEGSNTYYQLESLRNIPTLMWVQLLDELVPYAGTHKQAQRLDELGYRYRFDTFKTGEHLVLAIVDEYGPAVEWLGDAVVDRNPYHVSYVVNPAMDHPDTTLVGDHAYWLSGLRVRDQTRRGSIDAISLAAGLSAPEAQATTTRLGFLNGGNLYLPQPYVSKEKTWREAAPQPAHDKLRIVADNLAEVTVHPKRAGLSCNAAIEVESDGPLQVKLAGCERELMF